MHVDEAVHAVKFGSLLENNYYKYDPVEYHGPTLNYFTLIPSLLFGESELKEVTETTLRIVPVFAGLLLLALLFLLKDFGKEFLLSAFILTGFSSLIVFYNRYYIHESLLVSFSYSGIILGYKFLKDQKLFFLALSSIFFALAFASKETFIITVFAIFVSYLVLRIINRKNINIISLNLKAILIFAGTFVITSLFFYTSFFSNPTGAIDSLVTFANYLAKAGNDIEHIHPFYYYFALVTFADIDGIFFSELIVIIFFILGLFRVFTKSNSTVEGIDFIKFISIVTLVQIIVYSVIPYKTPWTMMSFWQGMIVVAAFGLAELRKFIPKFNWNLTLAFIAIFLFAQAYFNSIIYSSHQKNPFVYSHTESDIKTVEPLLTKVTAVQSEYLNTPVYVAASKNDYWPLPWYLKKFKKISWNEEITNDVYKFPIILASPDLENALIENLYSLPPDGSVNLYVPLFDSTINLRPGKEIRGYIRKDYLDKYNYTLTK
ncbi:MAG: membrane-bound mannosyltransferase-like protein [Ignavibacteria bacterium]|nr:MAG: membrane-bound mannosyltransferase-like protein [Ignavibacteria bacterium]KAF0161787.1 MAG: membrane-bound mannosyltransferase-like protein [Ignavibacteria bacterium]